MTTADPILDARPFLRDICAGDEAARLIFRDWLKEADIWTWDMLLQCILLYPDADGLRLLAADWCQESGLPGQAERAEFIRVQCNPLIEHAHPEHYRGLLKCRECEQANALRRRERELFARHGDDWYRSVVGILDPAAPPADVLLTCAPIDQADVPNYRACAQARRGFVEAITLSTASLVGEACRGCGPRTLDYPARRGLCSVCRSADSRIPGHAAALFAAAPIREVRLSDREPAETSHGEDEFPPLWGWVPARQPPPSMGLHPTAAIPEPLFAMIEGQLEVDTERWYSRHWKFFATRDLAHAALSRAGVAYGRREADLPVEVLL